MGNRVQTDWLSLTVLAGLIEAPFNVDVLQAFMDRKILEARSIEPEHRWWRVVATNETITKLVDSAPEYIYRIRDQEAFDAAVAVLRAEHAAVLLHRLPE